MTGERKKRSSSHARRREEEYKGREMKKRRPE